jgi:hypothetical protein
MGKLASETRIYRQDATNIEAYKKRLKQLASLVATALVECERQQALDASRQTRLPIL